MTTPLNLVSVTVGNVFWLQLDLRQVGIAAMFFAGGH